MNKRKMAVIAVMTIAIVFLVCGCRTAKSENDILADINSFNSIIDINHLSNCSIALEGRKTDKKVGFDEVWCTLTGENEYISYRGSYYISYSFYNHKWNVFSIEENDSEYSIKEGPGDAAVISYLESVRLNSDIEIVDHSQSSNDRVTYSFTEERVCDDGFLKVAGNGTASASWNLEQGAWNIYVSGDYNDYQPIALKDNLIGKWQGEYNFAGFLGQNVKVISIEITDVEDNVVKYNIGIAEAGDYTFATQEPYQRERKLIQMRRSIDGLELQSERPLLTAGDNEYYLVVYSSGFDNPDGKSGLYLRWETYGDEPFERLPD